MKRVVFWERIRGEFDDEVVPRARQRTLHVSGQLPSYRIRYAVESVGEVRTDNDASCHGEGGNVAEGGMVRKGSGGGLVSSSNCVDVRDARVI